MLVYFICLFNEPFLGILYNAKKFHQKNIFKRNTTVYLYYYICIQDEQEFYLYNT